MYGTIIGIKPLYKENAVAVYANGTLIALRMMKNDEILKTFKLLKPLFVIKAVDKPEKTETVFRVNQQKTYNVYYDLLKSIEFSGFDFVLCKKSSASWGDKKRFFDRETGWRSLSNKDQRDAAYYARAEQKNILRENDYVAS